MYLHMPIVCNKGAAQRTRRASFLILLQPEVREPSGRLDLRATMGPANTYAIVRDVSFDLAEGCTLGWGNLGGSRQRLSGTFGHDGMPMVVPKLPRDAVPVPIELHQVWCEGGPWDGTGLGQPTLRRWALDTVVPQRGKAVKAPQCKPQVDENSEQAQEGEVSVQSQGDEGSEQPQADEIAEQTQEDENSVQPQVGASSSKLKLVKKLKPPAGRHKRWRERGMKVSYAYAYGYGTAGEPVVTAHVPSIRKAEALIREFLEEALRSGDDFRAWGGVYAAGANLPLYIYRIRRRGGVVREKCMISMGSAA